MIFLIITRSTFIPPRKFYFYFIFAILANVATITKINKPSNTTNTPPHNQLKKINKLLLYNKIIYLLFQCIKKYINGEQK